MDPSSLLFLLVCSSKKLTAGTWKSPLLKGNIIFQTSILGFHVTFWGCRFFDFRRKVTAVLVCLTKAASQSGFWFKICWLWTDTLPETNIAPENGWLEDEFPFGEGLFSGAMLVSGRVISAFCQAKEMIRNGKGQNMDASVPSWQYWSDQLIGPIYKALQDFSKRNMAFNHEFHSKKTWCCSCRFKSVGEVPQSFLQCKFSLFLRGMTQERKTFDGFSCFQLTNDMKWGASKFGAGRSFFILNGWAIWSTLNFPNLWVVPFPSTATGFLAKTRTLDDGVSKT